MKSIISHTLAIAMAIVMGCASNVTPPPATESTHSVAEPQVIATSAQSAQPPRPDVVLQVAAPEPETSAPPAVVAGPPNAQGIRDGGVATGFLKRFPFQVWPSYKSTGRGLLVASNGKFGPLLVWTRTVGRLLPSVRNSPYWFLADGKSPVVVYFPSKGEGINFLRNWSVPAWTGSATFDAAEFTPDTPNGFGLNSEAHLVEFEVNGGQGGSGIHFVMTKVKVLDGTKEYPLAPTKALESALATWKNWLASQTSNMDKLVADASRSTPGKPYGPERDEVNGATIPTWLDTERTLRVSFYHQMTRTSTREVTRSRPYHCPPGAPCAAPMPETLTSTRSYGVEAAMTIDIDVTGAIVNATSFGPSATLPVSLSSE